MRPFSIIILFSLMAMAAGTFQDSVCAQSSLPKPSGYVNDFAGVITPPYEKRMGNVAKELLTKTGVSLYVVTMPDLGGSDAKEYAERLYNAWGLGEKGGDKGVLILASIRERKLQIRMGSGLNAVFSQRQIGEIQDRFVAPYLKQNNYDDGLLNGVLAMAKVIAKEYGVPLKGL